MTEADTIEVAAICAANSFTAFTIYISFTFGFLATAFFVGNKLTRFQAVPTKISIHDSISTLGTVPTQQMRGTGSAWI